MLPLALPTSAPVAATAGVCSDLRCSPACSVAPGRCQARLGSFNWAGTQSSSGAWVTPAFQASQGWVSAAAVPSPAAGASFAAAAHLEADHALPQAALSRPVLETLVPCGSWLACGDSRLPTCLRRIGLPICRPGFMGAPIFSHLFLRSCTCPSLMRWTLGRRWPWQAFANPACWAAAAAQHLLQQRQLMGWPPSCRRQL